MKTLYYGIKGHDDCLETAIDYCVDEIEADCIDTYIVEVEVVEFKQHKNSGYYSCTVFGGEAVHLCSRDCSDYDPRNNKNGICAFKEYGFAETGKKWRIVNTDKDVWSPEIIEVLNENVNRIRE